MRRMCGRVEYVVTRKKLEERYGATLIEGYTDQGIFDPHYNVPPSTKNPVLISENPEEISVGHWGYLPSWANGKNKTREVINARAETILEKTYFKSAISTRRCLIPITGFFEWKRDGDKKIPYHFHKKGEIFSLAGLYAMHKDKNGTELPHYAIITTEANELMSPIHDRIPVIIDREQETGWLQDMLEPQEVRKYLAPIASDYLSCHVVSTLVNNPRNNRPEILRPLER